MWRTGRYMPLYYSAYHRLSFDLKKCSFISYSDSNLAHRPHPCAGQWGAGERDWQWMWAVLPLLNDLVSFSPMFSLPELSLPSSSLGGSVGMAAWSHCGWERTSHWSLWLCGWSALASGLVVAEVEIVHSLAPWHITQALPQRPPCWPLSFGFSNQVLCDLCVLVLWPWSSLRTPVSPHWSKENFCTPVCSVARVLTHLQGTATLENVNMVCWEEFRSKLQKTCVQVFSLPLFQLWDFEVLT